MYLAMRNNTADVTGGKPIAVWTQCISGVRAINPFYDIHGRKREMLFFYFLYFFISLTIILFLILSYSRNFLVLISLLMSPLLGHRLYGLPTRRTGHKPPQKESCSGWWADTLTAALSCISNYQPSTSY
jgi:hypothetical protein